MSISPLTRIGRRISPLVLCLSALLFAALFPGCLVATKTVVAVYEPHNDQFRFLTVYQRIMNDKVENEAADQRWLTALYENRQHLIIAPEESFSPFESWGESAALRLPGGLWAELPLSAPEQAGLTSRRAEIPLEDIQIVPGRFFLRGPDNLCYYHEVIVPGKTADAVFAYVNRQFAAPGKDTPADWLGKLLDQRRKQEQPLAWDDFTTICIQKAIASINGDAATTQPTTAPTAAPQIPFDLASLQMLHDDLLAGKLPLVRHGDQVTLDLELTESDVAGAVSFADAFRAAVQDRLAEEVPNENPDSANMRKKLSRFMNCATVTAADKTHVRVTIDLTNLFNSFDDPVDTNPEPDKGARESGQRMAEFATGSLDLDVDQDLTVDSIEQDFKNGTLKGYPPQPSVAAGTDLGEIHPATEPAQ